MRRVILLALVLIITSGCSGMTAPERTVRDFLEKLRKGNISAAEKLTTYGSLGLSKRAADLYKPLFSTIQYSIGGSDMDGEQAVVSVTVTMAHLEGLVYEASAEAMQSILSGGEQDNFYALLLESLEEPGIPTITISATAILEKTGNQWKIDLMAPGGLADAITGGMGQILAVP
jgi:hypothetical protein